MNFYQSILFASDAEILALWGAGFIALSIVALIGDRRRSKRSDINKVSLVPWTSLFMASMIIGGGLIALSLPKLLAS